MAGAIVAAQSELEAVEQEERRSLQQIEELEAIARSRQHLADFAIAKRARTPVFALASATSKVLFYADAEDEFEVIEAREGWVHVRLADAGQAWLRKSDVEPQGQQPNVSDESGPKRFSATHQVIRTFTGEWPPLKGKSVLFELAQPRGEIAGDSLGKSQREFATYAFLEGYRAAGRAQRAIDGVVVVFMGDRPGVAAAVLSDVRRWQEGRISDELFLEHCSFDPPGSFRDISKR